MRTKTAVLYETKLCKTRGVNLDASESIAEKPYENGSETFFCHYFRHFLCHFKNRN